MQNPLGAKNNDSPSQKQAIVKFYIMEYRKCGNFNSKNDNRQCMGASAFLKSDDFRAFEVNVKTIALGKYLYQFGHAIWWSSVPMAIFSFIEEYDFSGKTIIPFCAHGTGGIAGGVRDITAALPDSVEILEPIGVYRPDIDTAQPDINEWLDGLGYKEEAQTSGEFRYSDDLIYLGTLIRA